MQWAQKQKGFTIVELLVVIVVIGILAAVTIVGYNGITQRANESAAAAAADSAQKSLSIYAIEHADSYPEDLSGLGLVSTDTTTYKYAANNTTTPAGYCLQTTAGGKNYRYARTYSYVSGGTPGTLNDAQTVAGECPEVDPPVVIVTNYSKNPSIETGTSSLGAPNSSSNARSTVRAFSGSASAVITMPASSSGTVGVSVFQENPFVTLQPNTEYVASAYVYVPAGVVDVRVAVQGAGVAGVANNAESYTSVKGQWVRIWNRFTTQSSGNVTVYVLNSGSNPTAGAQFWVDAVMVTSGTSPFAYRDGSSSGWSWLGTANSSQSTGPRP